MVHALLMMKNNKEVEERITKSKFSGLFFSALCGVAEFMKHFLQLYGQGFLSVTVSSNFVMVVTELLSYLKYRRPI